jgi:hypothetical protein
MLKVVVMLIAMIVGTISTKITRQILRTIPITIPTQNQRLVRQQRAGMSHRTKRSSGSPIRQSTRLLTFHNAGTLLGGKSRLH